MVSAAIIRRFIALEMGNAPAFCGHNAIVPRLPITTARISTAASMLAAVFPLVASVTVRALAVSETIMEHSFFRARKASDPALTRADYVPVSYAVFPLSGVLVFAPRRVS